MCSISNIFTVIIKRKDLIFGFLFLTISTGAILIKLHMEIHEILGSSLGHILSLNSYGIKIFFCKYIEVKTENSKCCIALRLMLRDVR